MRISNSHFLIIQGTLNLDDVKWNFTPFFVGFGLNLCH
jgi:hypothetical protein